MSPDPTELPDADRRTILKALGTGAVLGSAAGPVAAQEQKFEISVPDSVEVEPGESTTFEMSITQRAATPDDSGDVTELHGVVGFQTCPSDVVGSDEIECTPPSWTEYDVVDHSEEQGEWNASSTGGEWRWTSPDDITEGDTRSFSVTIEVPEDAESGSHEVFVICWSYPAGPQILPQPQLDERASVTVSVSDGIGDAVNATINAFDPPTGTYQTGERASAAVTLEHTGNESHTFYVGYGVVDPSGTIWDNDGSTHEPVTLAPGETETVSVDWITEPIAPSGTYNVGAAIWEREEDGNLYGQLDVQQVDNAFTVDQPTGAVVMESTISGTVTYADTSPVQNAAVVAMSTPRGTESSMEFVAWTDDSGQYDLYLTPGRYELVAYKEIDGTEYASPPITISIGLDEHLDRDLSLQELSSLSDEVESAIHVIETLLHGAGEVIAHVQGLSVPVSWAILPSLWTDLLPSQPGDESFTARRGIAYAVSQPIRQRSSGAAPRSAPSEAVQISAEITRFMPAEGEFTAGDVVSSEIAVENTGDATHTFFVGYGAVGPEENQYDSDGTTGTSISLDSGASTTVTVEWTVPSESPEGSYNLGAAVWAESTPDALQTRLDSDVVSDAITVAPS